MATRRHFMRMTARTLASVGVGSQFARFGMMNALAQSAPNYKALVCIFLFGGNDGNNLVVPTSTAGWKSYTDARQSLALDPSLIHGINSTQGPFALHPQLTDLASLYSTKKKLALVTNVGTLVKPTTAAQYKANLTQVPSNLFSHSDQQLQWQTDVTSGYPSTGWAGRTADLLGSLNAPSKVPMVISTAGNTLFGRGNTTNLGTASPGGQNGLHGFNGASGLARQAAMQAVLNFDNGITLVQKAKTDVVGSLDNAALLNKALGTNPPQGPVTTVFPNTGLGNQLKLVANLINSRSALEMNRQIFFCSIGGFDTHSNQLADQGKLMQQLNDAILAFYTATEQMNLADSVTTFTQSDFSRTLKSNSNLGSDHAWGSHHMVVGGMVKGGDLYGKFPDLTLGGNDDAGNEGRWVPSTSLDQYGATLASWFGVPDIHLPDVFPNLGNFTTKTLKFV